VRWSADSKWIYFSWLEPGSNWRLPSKAFRGLMAHGRVDTNVNFEDSVRLTQRLIELGKRDWWLVPYPVKDHGFLINAVGCGYFRAPTLPLRTDDDVKIEWRSRHMGRRRTFTREAG
jgi:hypothetical protein